MKNVLISIILLFISTVFAQSCSNPNYSIKRNESVVFEIDGTSVSIRNSALFVNGEDVMASIAALKLENENLTSEIERSRMQMEGLKLEIESLKSLVK